MEDEYDKLNTLNTKGELKGFKEPLGPTSYERLESGNLRMGFFTAKDRHGHRATDGILNIRAP